MRFTVRRIWIVSGLAAALLIAWGVVACSRPRPVAEPAVKDKGQADAPLPAAQDGIVSFGADIHRNLANLKDKGLPATWVVEEGKQEHVKWTAKLGSHAYGGPIVAAGRVFVGTNNDSPRDPAIKGDKGVMMCFRESDGKFLWQIVHDKNDGDIDAAQQGVTSCPTVEGDRLYYLNNRCELVCAAIAGDKEKPGQGKIIWKLDFIKKFDVFPGGLGGSVPTSSPLILGDLIYVLTSNGTNGTTGKVEKPKAPSLVAVNKKTGEPVWKNDMPGAAIMDGQWSSPVAAEAHGETLVIYGGGDGWLYALEAKTGDLRWKFDCNPKAAEFKPAGRGDRAFIVATPVVYENRLYVAVGAAPDDCSGVGHLWCVDVTKKPTNKAKDISPFSDPKDRNPKFDPKDPKNKDAGLVWHYGGKLDPKPADAKRDIVFSKTLGTVAIADGLVYAAETTGYMNCLDARTGELYWTYDMKDGTWCSPYYVDGKVLIGTESSEIVVFEAGKKLKEPKRIEMISPVHTPPVFVNGVLYVMNGTNLFAIK